MTTIKTLTLALALTAVVYLSCGCSKSLEGLCPQWSIPKENEAAFIQYVTECMLANNRPDSRALCTAEAEHRYGFIEHVLCDTLTTAEQMAPLSF